MILNKENYTMFYSAVIVCVCYSLYTNILLINDILKLYKQIIYKFYTVYIHIIMSEYISIIYMLL